MVRSSFNDGWTVKRKVSSFTDILSSSRAGEPVTLPHDAMILFDRSTDFGEGPSTGYFPGGAVEYAKTFDAPHSWKDALVSLEFQGVYRDAMVFVNGMFAGQRRNGYAPFRVPVSPYLRYGAENVVRVEARAHQDSRWYSGLGIYRDTALVVTPLTHIAADGVRITTTDVDEERAVLEVVTTVRNESTTTRALSLRSTVVGANGEVVAADEAPVTVPPRTATDFRQRLYVREPRLWDVEAPHMYQVQTRLLEDGSVCDYVQTPVGIRTLRLDPICGLRINGKSVKLRGACIHHDNGPLGAAAIGRAEERRIEILKEAGFNAVRSSHNMASPALLDACDRLGMLVVDEAFDMWFECMKAFDYSLDFPEWWERDLESMVRKDFNHPSVIMYSIGNEIPDTGTPLAGNWGRELAGKLRSLDPTRFTTNAISSFWAVSGEILDDFRQEISALEGMGVNEVMNGMTDIFERITRSDLVSERTAESHAAVDVAGLNYAEGRYEEDGTRYPNRVILGTETNPRNIGSIWPMVESLPHVIGDFTWTGWDYIGEVGLGRTEYVERADAAVDLDPAFPWLLAWCGDIDITGHRRPVSYYREIVYGLRVEPYIAVFRPVRAGVSRVEMQWAWSDAVSTWTWDVPAGSMMEVEVYSGSQEVELQLDGKLIARAPAGPAHGFRATFNIEFRPGSLTAIALDQGRETSRSTLRTASQAELSLDVDRQRIRADHSDLAFVAIELRDAEGILETSADRLVSVEVSGAGILQALGSARPMTEERFHASECTTFDGRALAIVRPTGVGSITVTVRSSGLLDATADLEAWDE